MKTDYISDLPPDFIDDVSFLKGPLALGAQLRRMGLDEAPLLEERAAPAAAAPAAAQPRLVANPLAAADTQSAEPNFEAGGTFSLRSVSTSHCS